jgi:hypothetical protein
VVSFNVVLVIYLFFVRENNAFVEEIVRDIKYDPSKVSLDVGEEKQEHRSLVTNNVISESSTETTLRVNKYTETQPPPNYASSPPLDDSRTPETHASSSSSSSSSSSDLSRSENIMISPPVLKTEVIVQRPKHVLYKSWSDWINNGQPHGSIESLPGVASGDTAHYMPHFAIIGAQKGGTTYLRWLLVQHPNLESGDGLHGETRGEPHFFDWGYPSGRKGDDKLAVVEKYAKMFHSPKSKGGESGTLYFDTTPAYIVEQEVPLRLHNLLPNIKLIAIVRDPTDRYRSELQVSLCA